MLTEWTRERTTADAVEALSDAGVVASPVQDIDDILSWPHLQARGMIDTVEHPELGPLPGLKAAGFPLQFGAADSGYAGAAARSGAHNGEIFAGLLGLDDREIDDLKDRGII